MSGLVDRPNPAPYPFGPTTIADIFVEGLQEHPGRLALVDGARSWTWTELESEVRNRAQDIAPGEHTWFDLVNSAELVIAILATFMAGGIWVASPDADRRADVVAVGNRSSKADPHAPALIAFTSGTTGSPKAVVHSQHSLLAPGLVSIEQEPPWPGERIGTPLDLKIANVALLGPISALLRGSTFVVMNRRYSTGLASDISSYNVSRLFAVPTMAYDLVEAPEVEPQQLNILDRLILGGSGADPAMLANFHTKFGVRPTLSYGLSEAPTGVARESLNDPVGSGRGFPLPHVEILVVDADGQSVPTGVIGEICIRPASIGPWANTWTGTLGYLDQPDETARLFDGDMLHTGDLGRLDTDGAVSVTGRLSSLIIRGGKNVDPVAIERQLLAIRSIKEALVVGIPDERLGQIVGALLVLDLDNWTSIEILDWVKISSDIEAQTGTPLGAVEIVKQLPRNAMGKVVREVPDNSFGPNTRLR